MVLKIRIEIKNIGFLKKYLPRSTIGYIENNQFENPRVYTAIKLAHALGVSVEDIFIL